MKILIVESLATDERAARTELAHHGRLTGTALAACGDIVLLTHQDKIGNSHAVVLRTPPDIEEYTVEFERI